MNIVVWSDIACPFCYIAGTRVRRALKALHAEDLFTIERKSYELSPQITVSEPCLSFYAKKMDVTEEDIAPGLRKIEREAAKDGLVFHYDRAIAANTFNAHRLVKYAAAHGVPDMLDRLFEAHFRDGLDVGSRDVLEELARREGLSAGFLDTEQYAAEVRGDEEEAKKLGIRLVPHFIIDGKLTYKGALSQDYMTGVFRNIMQKNNLLPLRERASHAARTAARSDRQREGAREEAALTDRPSRAPGKGRQTKEEKAGAFPPSRRISSSAR